MRDWHQGTKAGEHVSMGVVSDGSYGAPKDVVFSFPVTCKCGKWTIVQGLQLDDFTRNLLKVTGDELLEERKEAMEVCATA